MQRRDVSPAGEKAACFFVRRILPDRRVIGSYVRSVRSDRNRLCKKRLLPARGGLVDERRSPEQNAIALPQAAGVHTEVGLGFVETYPGNDTVKIGADLHAHLDRSYVRICSLNRYDSRWVKTERRRFRR